MPITNSLNLIGSLGQVATTQPDGTLAMQDPAGSMIQTVSRSLNTIYQAPSNRKVLCFYTVDVQTVLTLTGGQSGTCILEMCPTNTFLSGVIRLSDPTYSNTGALVVGVTLNQINSANLSGVIEKGYFYRIRTVNNTGTPTYTLKAYQEVNIL